MTAHSSRRLFLQSATAGGMLTGLGDLSFLQGLPQLTAAEVKSGRVGLQPDIEPLVQLLEDSPRSKLLERVAARIQQGLTYREVLTALQLAGVRNIQPRPSVGFKFHAVLVVNSAHLASVASPDEHRWLPIFWALDYFKSAQARDVQEGDWTMQAVEEARVPSADKALTAFRSAMDNWDEQAADAAVAGLARTQKQETIYEEMFRYGMRDFRSIGHKAIYVANSYRTLQEIGWSHAEPILRSLAYALLMHEGSNPAERDSDYDRHWRENLQRVTQIRADWAEGRTDSAATEQLLTVLRNNTPAQASEQVVEMLNTGIAPQSIWDALFVAGGELLVRDPGIPAIHNLTFTNAMRFAYDTTTNDETRRLLLLQNAAFLPWMREQRMRFNGPQGRFALTELADVTEPKLSPGDQLDAIFNEVSSNRLSAAGRVLAYLDQGNSPADLMNAARLLVFLKGTDSHDYKFSSAVLEDFGHVSPTWRNRFLASSVFNLSGTKTADNKLVQRTRAAFSS